MIEYIFILAVVSPLVIGYLHTKPCRWYALQHRRVHNKEIEYRMTDRNHFPLRYERFVVNYGTCKRCGDKKKVAEKGEHEHDWRRFE